MTTFTLAHRASSQSRVKSVSLPAVNWKLVYILAIGALLAMLVFYIYSINMLTGGSYVIKNYNKQISALEQENSSLEATFAASGFMGSVQEKAAALNFEKTTQVTYISGTDTALSMAR